MFTRMTWLFHKVIALQIVKTSYFLLHFSYYCKYGVLVFDDDGTGPADESKRTKCAQGWSRKIMGGRLLLFAILFVK